VGDFVMARVKTIEFEIDHKFDSMKNRHYLNGDCTVLHCHHYATLYTQLALDAVDFEGVRHLTEASEDVFFDVLNRYFAENEITDIDEKVEIAQQYWQASGMGLISFTGVGKYEVVAEMEYSHIDEGWLKKWGGSDKPVNFFTVGFVAAVAALVNNKPVRTFKATETKSLACGDEKCEFKAVIS
jgi:predicted hydrocarbon binding protein